MAKDTAPATYFSSAEEFREWLAKNHEHATELLVGFHKAATGRPRMTWAESVDEALCVGWIDAIRRRVDDERYTIRFCPRKATSVWSAVNIRRVGELENEGRMQPAGRAAFARRKENRSGIYSYEQRPASLDEPYASLFRKQKKAWAYFGAQAPWYRRAASWYVLSAKREETRLKRLAILIEDSANKRWLAGLVRTNERGTAADAATTAAKKSDAANTATKKSAAAKTAAKKSVPAKNVAKQTAGAKSRPKKAPTRKR